jgi:N-sulfoglucosamine sulfohydrolase
MPQQPWFVYTNFGITHESSIWPDEPVIPNRPANAFIGGGRPRPPRVTDPAAVPVPPYLPDTPVVREDIARHYDNIAALDAEVGQVLDALDASGQRDNMVVVFLVDHGRGLPREKRWCYTAGLHMPLIVRWPSGLKAGTVDQRLVSWVDIAPTLLSLTGVPIPEDYDGQVFLGPAAAAPREHAFAGRDRMDEAYDLVRIVRTSRWHYVRNFWTRIPYAQRNHYMEHMPTTQELRRMHAAGQLRGDAAAFMQYPKPAEELYDVQRDPHCVRNLAAEPAHAEQRRRLRAVLDEWIERTGDLGQVPERDLVKRGLVADKLAEYASRVAPLPQPYRIGPERGPLEMNQAAALEAGGDNRKGA